jgi:hypothetical protein
MLRIDASARDRTSGKTFLRLTSEPPLPVPWEALSRPRWSEENQHSLVFPTRQRPAGLCAYSRGPLLGDCRESHAQLLVGAGHKHIVFRFALVYDERREQRLCFNTRIDLHLLETVGRG